MGQCHCGRRMDSNLFNLMLSSGISLENMVIIIKIHLKLINSKINQSNQIKY